MVAVLCLALAVWADATKGQLVVNDVKAVLVLDLVFQPRHKIKIYVEQTLAFDAAHVVVRHVLALIKVSSIRHSDLENLAIRSEEVEVAVDSRATDARVLL